MFAARTQALLEAGAISGNGLESALQTPGFEPTALTLPSATFMGNSGVHVTAEQAAFIAGWLRQAVDQDAVWHLLLFLDNRPETGEVIRWVQGFADFNEWLAAQ